ncbi:LytR family transcriptional regulator [Occultella glacieicola]|uniref:LytR family transcriptional regulator n=1 Tax=Occultella glacieicola TaxID=2518684 RepID=A0ABY2E447_9MICO|nr:LCP family protein [Occultella glacieicola]TDE93978.1 LytR family transcriptional regulator [Occultella glacieicola]
MAGVGERGIDEDVSTAPADDPADGSGDESRGDRPERKQRSRARVALIVAAGLIVLLVGGLILTVAAIQNRIAANIDWIEDPFEGLTDRPSAGGAPSSDATEAPPGSAVNILMLGSDSRISAGDPSQWSYGAQRTDAIMLVHIAGDRQSAQIMSIPRDSWVTIPGHGDHKINAAFSFGGPALMIQTVEALTGVHIDHFAIADFESFAILTDELGGVEIDLPNGLDNAGVVLAPGAHTLTGDEALAYARQRYGLPAGDFDRVARQQNWMRAMVSQAFRTDVLADPLALTGLLDAVSSSLSVDEGFTVATMRDLALSMRDLRPGSMDYLTVPVEGTGRSPDGRQSIVVLDQARFDALMDAVAADTVSQYVAEHPDDVTTLGSAVN